MTGPLRKLAYTCAGAFGALFLSRFLAPYLPVIYASSQYVGLHTFLEFFSTFVAFTAFLVLWLSREDLEGPAGGFLVILGTSFLAVGSIDLFHALGTQDMPAFITPSSYEKSMFLAMAAKFWIIIGFFIAFVVLHTMKTHIIYPVLSLFLVAVNLMVAGTALFLATNDLTQSALYIEGSGLTWLKISLEYGVIIAYILIFGILFMHRSYFKDTVYINLGYFLIFSLAAETAFSFYSHVSDNYNLTGHIYKICAYWFIFRAMYLSGVIDHLRTLSEMGKMSAEILTDRGATNILLAVQMDKLQHLIPHARRVIFYIKEDGDYYRTEYVWGKYSESSLLHSVIHFRNMSRLLGRNVARYDKPYDLLSPLSPEDYTPEISAAWKAANQLLYIPLIQDDRFYGSIMLFSFDWFSRFSDADLEKASVFQKFATLAIAHIKYEQTISRISYEDSMTKLPNRRFFFEQMLDVEYEAARYHVPFTLIFLDMNGLKQINDNYGHAAGDAALHTIAEMLKSILRKSDIAARLGGDEFGIILKHSSLEDGQIKIAELREYFSAIWLSAYDVYFSLAVGGANFPAEAATEEALLKLADDRMYEHKRRIKSAAQNSASA